MTKSGWVAAIAALAVTPLLATSGSRHGTNILHFNTKVPMVNQSVDSSNATGTVTATQATQGNADKETLTVAAKGLFPNTPYSLLVSTTTSGLSDVDTNLNTDSRGRLTVKLSTNPGKRNVAIPSNAVPVSTIQEVDIEDSNSAPVLVADFTNATSLQYLVKQNISTNDGVSVNTSASLQIKSTLNRGTSRTSFSLNASGLNALTDYLLVFNGGVVQTNTSNSRGRLKINSAPTPDPILSLTSVDVTDTNSVPVTATATLP